MVDGLDRSWACSVSACPRLYAESRSEVVDHSNSDELTVLQVQGRSSRGTRIMMRMLGWTVKPSLFVLLGMVAFISVSFSSTVPSFLRTEAAQADGAAPKQAVVPASQNAVLGTGTPGPRAARRSGGNVLGSKWTKRVDRPAERKHYTKSMAPHTSAQPTHEKNNAVRKQSSTARSGVAHDQIRR